MTKVEGKTVVFRGETLEVYKAEYKNGRVALELRTPEGEPYVRATTNIPELPLGRNEAFVRNYSECQDLPEALEKAGVVRLTGRSGRSGYVEEIPIAEVLV